MERAPDLRHSCHFCANIVPMPVLTFTCYEIVWFTKTVKHFVFPSLRLVLWLKTARRWHWMHQKVLPPSRAVRKELACHSTNFIFHRSVTFEMTHFLPPFYVSNCRLFIFCCLLDFWAWHNTGWAVWEHSQKPNEWFLGWEERTDIQLWCNQCWENLHNPRYGQKHNILVKFKSCKVLLVMFWSPAGSPKEPGILPRVLESTFQYIGEHQYPGMDLKPYLRNGVQSLDFHQVKQERITKAAIFASFKEVRTQFCQMYSRKEKMVIKHLSVVLFTFVRLSSGLGVWFSQRQWLSRVLFAQPSFILFCIFNSNGYYSLE